MFLLRRPNDRLVQRVIDDQREKDFTYAHLGATRDDECPVGFHENRGQAVIGRGAEVFGRAKQAIRDWRMLNLGWIQTVVAPDEISEGELVATVARAFGVYSLNVARIVYVDDEPHRYGLRHCDSHRL